MSEHLSWEAQRSMSTCCNSSPQGASKLYSEIAYSSYIFYRTCLLYLGGGKVTL